MARDDHTDRWRRVYDIYKSCPDGEKKDAASKAYSEYRRREGEEGRPAGAMLDALMDSGILRRPLATDDGAQEYEDAMAAAVIMEGGGG